MAKCMFLTQITADGLKKTLQSTIDLVEYLLNECNFAYVLTAKFNQDHLEVRLFNKKWFDINNNNNNFLLYN